MMLLAASDTRTSLGPADLRQELLPALQEAARDAFQQLSATKFAEVPGMRPCSVTLSHVNEAEDSRHDTC